MINLTPNCSATVPLMKDKSEQCVYLRRICGWSAAALIASDFSPIFSTRSN